MLAPITIRYTFRPNRRSLTTGQVGAFDAFALPGTVEEWLATLAGCGLSEARLLDRREPRAWC